MIKLTNEMKQCDHYNGQDGEIVINTIESVKDKKRDVTKEKDLRNLIKALLERKL